VTRQRADALLVDLGFFGSREQAHAAILAGEVRIDGDILDKPGRQLSPEAGIVVAARPKYVSRGGLKLAEALERFGIDPSGMRALDVGASTGGFSDCLLQHGAVSVVALDVGYGQLAWSLRTDPRVTVFERTNIRSADPSVLGAPFDIAVVDVSFISLLKVLGPVSSMVGEDGCIVALVKPQFEAGKGRVGKKGVVRDASVHVDVLRAVVEGSRASGWVVRGLTWSPVRGPEGNIEFLMWLSREGESSAVEAEEAVARAHEALGGAGARPASPEHGER